MSQYDYVISQTALSRMCTDGDYGAHSVVHRIRMYVLYGLFCVVIFRTGTALGGDSIMNARIIWWNELIFIGGYLCCNNILPCLRRIVANNIFATSCLLLWIFSVAYSTAFSPYHEEGLYHHNQRLMQSVTHIFFAVIVYDYVVRYRPRMMLPLLGISLSVAYVTLAFFYLSPTGIPHVDMFTRPPFYGSIRHAGYHAAVGTCVSVIGTCFVVRTDSLEYRVYRWPLLVLAIMNLSFLLWMASRSQCFSLLLVICMSYVVYWRCRERVQVLWGAAVLVVLCSIVLSEMFAVSDWTGFWSLLDRSTSVKEGGTYGSGRVAIWESTWISIQQSPYFGFGTDSYMSMENHIFGLHPHNVILQCLLEWGFVGSILFAGFFCALVKKIGDHCLCAWRTGSELSIVYTILLMIIVALSGQALLDGTYYYGQTCLYIAFSFAVLLAIQTPSDCSQAVPRE